jgi:hypothetical protein
MAWFFFQVPSSVDCKVAGIFHNAWYTYYHRIHDPDWFNLHISKKTLYETKPSISITSITPITSTSQNNYLRVQYLHINIYHQ